MEHYLVQEAFLILPHSRFHWMVIIQVFIHQGRSCYLYFFREFLKYLHFFLFKSIGLIKAAILQFFKLVFEELELIFAEEHFIGLLFLHLLVVHRI